MKEIEDSLSNLEELIIQLEKENNELSADIENVRSNSIKLNEAKKLILEYSNALKEQKLENEKIKQNIQDIVSELNLLPNFIKNKIIKDDKIFGDNNINNK
jgi:chromosome segregation ATPase